MSIRAIAQELYRCQKEVHKLEDQLQEADHQMQTEIKEKLRIARAELKQLKNMMEGRKAQSLSDRKHPPFSFKF